MKTILIATAIMLLIATTVSASNDTEYFYDSYGNYQGQATTSGDTKYYYGSDGSFEGSRTVYR